MKEAFLIHFHEIVLLVYLICIVAFILDLFQKNRRLQAIGFNTLWIVWLGQTISLTIFILWRGYLPLTSIVESMLTLTWLILTISFILASLKQSDFMVVFLNILGFIFMAINTFHPYQFQLDVSRITVVNELLVFHISLALISYVIFAVAFVNSILYLIQHHNLKEKKFTQNFFRISSLSTLEKLVFYSTVLGNLLLFASLILGIQWSLMTVGANIFTDIKVISSLLIFLCYTIYILCRLTNRFKHISLMYSNIVLFLSCMINLVFITQMSSFHQWTGV